MKDKENTITMAGEQMEILLSASCLSCCKPSLAAQLPSIVPKLCRTLSMRSVAKKFINYVRIGDTIALVDRQAGDIFRLKMEAHSIRVLEIDRTTSPLNQAARVFYLIDSSLWERIPGKRKEVMAA